MKGEAGTQESTRSPMLFFATNNKDKVREARSVLSKYGIGLRSSPLKLEEIQDESLRAIALHSLKLAFEVLAKDVFVEDAGLFINSINGFPGPYSSYVYKTLGVNGILKLLSSHTDRRAEFRSVVALGLKGRRFKCFEGIVKGRISHTSRGRGGFGFDPIFIPDGYDRTFAEMSLEEKHACSHRGISLTKMARWYLSAKSLC